MRDQRWAGVTCPTCGAAPRANCRTSSGKPAAPHVARLAAAAPKLTPEEIERRQHEQRMFGEQVSKRTLVRVAFTYSCGCGTDLSEPIPLNEANTWPARAVICDSCDEYSVISGVDVRLVADEQTLYRILAAADVDEGSAAYVARDQNDEARTKRVKQGRTAAPS